MLTFWVLLLAHAWLCAHALTCMPGEAVEGAEACSASESLYGSAYVVVAAKPPADSDFAFAPATATSDSVCNEPVKRCGDVLALESACRSTPGCIAFNYDGSCGFLKAATAPRARRAGWSVCVLQALQAEGAQRSELPAGSPPSNLLLPRSERRVTAPSPAMRGARRAIAVAA